LDQAIALSCAPIAEKFAETGESFVVTGARLDKIAEKQDLMCASFVRIGAMERRIRSCARTVAKSGAINAKCVATDVSFTRIDETCAVTDATSGMTGAMPGTRKQGE
jgi:hypothetical protein